MGWIWVIFVLFSVLSNILEKLMAEQKVSRPVKPRKEGGQPLPPALPFPPFLMDEVEAEREPIEALPKAKTDLPSTSDGKMAPANLWGHPQEQEKKMADEEWDRLFNQENGFEEEDLGAVYYTDADEAVKLEDPAGREIDNTRFYDALILAHVLPRPDFRSAPWRRRL